MEYLWSFRSLVEAMKRRHFRLGNSSFKTVMAQFLRQRQGFDEASKLIPFDIFETEVSLVPIYTPNHWTLCVVNGFRNSVQYFDLVPNGVRARQVLNKIKQFLEQLARVQGLRQKKWTLEDKSNVTPRQSDGTRNVWIRILNTLNLTINFKDH